LCIGSNENGKRFKWELREEEEIKQECEGFANHLKEALERRLSSVENNPTLQILQTFDAQNLVKLYCGKRDGANVVYDIPEGEIKQYGVLECQQFLSTVVTMEHIKSSTFNFDPRMTHKYIGRLKDAVNAGIWMGYGSAWFVESDNKSVFFLNENSTIKELKIDHDKHDDLDAYFVICLSNGSQLKVKLSKSSFYSSIYSDERIYNIAKPEACIMLDIALSKGGPDIAESFYNSMRNQLQQGGQSNTNLLQRAKVNWCLPSIKNCSGIVSEVVKIYNSGDANIQPHRPNLLFSNRAKKHNVSKVIDRLDSGEGRCPFLSQ